MSGMRRVSEPQEILSITGTSIASASFSTTGTVFYPGAASDLSIWIKVVRANGVGATSMTFRLMAFGRPSEGVEIPITINCDAAGGSPVTDTRNPLTVASNTTYYRVLQTTGHRGALCGCRLDVQPDVDGIVGDSVTATAVWLE